MAKTRKWPTEMNKQGLPWLRRSRKVEKCNLRSLGRNFLSCLLNFVPSSIFFQDFFSFHFDSSWEKKRQRGERECLQILSLGGESVSSFLTQNLRFSSFPVKKFSWLFFPSFRMWHWQWQDFIFLSFQSSLNLLHCEFLQATLFSYPFLLSLFLFSLIQFPPFTDCLWTFFPQFNPSNPLSLTSPRLEGISSSFFLMCLCLKVMGGEEEKKILCLFITVSRVRQRNFCFNAIFWCKHTDTNRLMANKQYFLRTKSHSMVGSVGGFKRTHRKRKKARFGLASWIRFEIFILYIFLLNTYGLKYG